MFNFFKKIKVAKKFLLSPRPANGPNRQTEFEMYLEPVDVFEYIKRLQDYGFDTEIITEIEYRNEKYPVLQVIVTGTQSKKNLLLFAGVHGNEFAGILAVEDILGKLKANPELYNQWSIRVLAPINPVGVAYMSRYDQDGYDINRDFKKFMTIGAQLQRDVIDDFKPDILVTLHESPKEGFFIFSEGKLPDGLGNAIAQELQAVNIEIAKKTYFGTGTKAGIWEKPPHVYKLQELLGMNTLGSYIYKRKIPTLTTESTWSQKDMAARKLSHVATVMAILKNSDLI